MSDKPMGAGLSPEAKRLLRGARGVRLMTIAERARAAAVVSRLQREAEAAPGGFFRRAVTLAGAAFLVLGVGTNQAVLVEALEIKPDEIRAEAPRAPFAWIYDVPASDPSHHDATATPGLGDICGQRVCARKPSCCVGAWDEACDAELLALTRLPNWSTPIPVGRCYWHDREICPACKCPAYLKRLETAADGDKPGLSVGFDGGSGCLRGTQPLLWELKWLCVQKYCEE